MTGSGQTKARRKEIIVELLREVIRHPDMLFVMGRGPEAVMEGWVDSEQTRVTLTNDWLTVESEPWHCHSASRR